MNPLFLPIILSLCCVAVFAVFGLLARARRLRNGAQLLPPARIRRAWRRERLAFNPRLRRL